MMELLKLCSMFCENILNKHSSSTFHEKKGTFQMSHHGTAFH